MAIGAAARESPFVGGLTKAVGVEGKGRGNNKGFNEAGVGDGSYVYFGRAGYGDDGTVGIDATLVRNSQINNVNTCGVEAEADVLVIEIGVVERI